MYTKRIFSFSIILLLLIISVGAASASDNTTQILNENPTNNAKTFEDIQTAIDAAGDNGTVELEGTYTSQGSAIKITKPITIIGKNNTTLNGLNKSNVFIISNVNVTIENLNIINSASESLAAVYSQGNLNITNTSFINNIVHNPEILSNWDFDEDEYHMAGAIFTANELTITDCYFENNCAEIQMMDYEFFDTYLYELGGSIYSMGNLKIKGSRFKDTYVESLSNAIITDSKFEASALKCYGESVISNSVFSKNPDLSSAVFTSADILIENCSFTANGGYAITGSGEVIDVIIKSSIFENNNLECSGYYDYESGEDFNIESDIIGLDNCNLFVYDSNFTNNTGNSIFNHDGNVYVENSIFAKNSAYRGAAIHSTNTTVINSTFKDNRATFAGAIYSEYLIIKNCTFAENHEGAVETEIYCEIDDEKYTGLTYFDNSLNKIEIVKMTVQNLKTTYQSGKTISLKMIYTESKRPLKNYCVSVKIIKGKKVIYDDIYTNSKGIAYLKTSNLDVGTCKIIFNCDDEDLKPITVTFKISKADTIVKAPKITSKYKKTKYFKITVKNKATKKPVKNLKLKVKVFTKGKYITHMIKTNNNGQAKLNIKNLIAGKHKVIILSGNANYKVSAKSEITIKK